METFKENKSNFEDTPTNHSSTLSSNYNVDKDTVTLLARFAFKQTTEMEKQKVQEIIEQPLGKLIYDSLLEEKTKFNSYEEYEKNEIDREENGLLKLKEKLNIDEQ